MDSITRVLKALSYDKPDRVPFNFWLDRRLMNHYQQTIGHRHWRVTHYGADVIETFPRLDFPAGPVIERNGTSWQTGAYFESWDQVDDIPMPDPSRETVYELIKADINEFPDKAIFANFATSWGLIAKMRTYENIYVDMYEYPEQFKKLSRRITDVLKVAVEHACRMGITALYLQEDLATSRGLSMSPNMINEFCLDYARELVEIAHSYDKPVLFHSDGSIKDLTALLLQLGITAVNPLQPNVNNASEFKQLYDNQIAVYGGLDNCFIIPQATPDQIHLHILDVFSKLGRPAGGLVFSTHDIPVGTPEENIETMVRTIRQECVY